MFLLLFIQTGSSVQESAVISTREEAQYPLARMYYKGVEINQLAFAWLRKAAAQGHAKAQILQGLIEEELNKLEERQPNPQPLGIKP